MLNGRKVWGNVWNISKQSEELGRGIEPYLHKSVNRTGLVWAETDGQLNTEEGLE
jgi:hypothetical protein